MCNFIVIIVKVNISNIVDNSNHCYLCTLNDNKPNVCVPTIFYTHTLTYILNNNYDYIIFTLDYK